MCSKISTGLGSASAAFSMWRASSIVAGREHLDARDVGVPAFQAVRMLGGELAAGAGRHADDQRHGKLAARHVRDGRRIVEDLVEGEQAEIAGHDLDDRAQSGHRRADAGADEGALGKRRVADAARAEFVEQSLGHRVAAAVERRHPRP